MSFSGKNVFITGASRGIGKAIALKLAAEGANIIVVAKSIKEDPRLGGTIYSAAEEIQAAGGKALAVQCDIRDEEQVIAAVEQAISIFGGIDILINNASAISMTSTELTETKRYDLMYNINVRGYIFGNQNIAFRFFASLQIHIYLHYRHHCTYKQNGWRHQ